MDSLTRSINFELPRDLHFDKYAQQVLENSSKSSTAAAATSAVHASTPTITTFDALTNSEFLQKVGASILNSIQLKHKFETSSVNTLESTENTSMDPIFAPNHVVIDSSSFNAMDELQKQLEYDKFMNEVWIGIVFTLILISMIFCICSCFLYHQFRTWKRNYHNSSNHCSRTSLDIEKLHPDFEDPVPEYTLVSGLPSYEAALELLHKTPKSCLIVHPSVFNIFNKTERANMELIATTIAAPTDAATVTQQQQQEQQQQQQHLLSEVTMPLLTANNASITPTATATTTTQNPNIKSDFLTIPSYAEAISFKTIDEKSNTTSSTQPSRNKSDSNLLTLTQKMLSTSNDKC